MKQTTYFLSLEKRPGDTKFIDISKLSISHGFYPTTLQEIDSFTMNFTILELKNALKEDNLIEEDYINGKLIIQDNDKSHSLEVIDKDLYNDFNLYNYFKERINNKELINNVIYKLITLVKDDNIIYNIKLAKNNQDIYMLVNIILNIDYYIQREYILYLMHLVLKERNNKNQERVRDKAA